MVGPACEKGLGQDQVTLLDEQEETSKENASHFVEHPNFHIPGFSAPYYGRGN